MSPQPSEIGPVEVHKFGGTSVDGPERLRAVAALVARGAAPRRVVVVSAMGKVTDRLVEAMGGMKSPPRLVHLSIPGNETDDETAFARTKADGSPDSQWALLFDFASIRMRVGCEVTEDCPPGHQPGGDQASSGTTGTGTAGTGTAGTGTGTAGTGTAGDREFHCGTAIRE